jgi:hypothetical protein
MLHLSLLHPQDYSVEQILKVLNEKPYLAGQNKQGYRNWQYMTRMFSRVGSAHSSYYYGNTDVKLSICRFVAELLNRTTDCSPLDETMEDSGIPGVYDLSFPTYGTALMLEFCQVFRALYIDVPSGKTPDTGDHFEMENAKVDICVCLNILLSKTESSKRAALD